MAELYRHTHHVSHFQIDLVSKGALLVEHDVGGTLVAFAPGHINVATAWDENGSVPPLVEISISGYEPLSAAGIAGLIPVAAGFLDVGPSGVEVGNYIMSDVSVVALPKGRYAVTVFLETLEPMAARKVHFHFRNAE
jgi:hypothetical protein